MGRCVSMAHTACWGLFRWFSNSPPCPNPMFQANVPNLMGWALLSKEVDSLRHPCQDMTRRIHHFPTSRNNTSLGEQFSYREWLHLPQLYASKCYDHNHPLFHMQKPSQAHSCGVEWWCKTGTSRNISQEPRNGQRDLELQRPEKSANFSIFS